MRRRYLAVSTLVVLLLVPLAALAGGSVTGRVVDRDSGAPLAGEVTVATPGGEWVTAVPCDAEGNYVAADLAPGPYLLAARVPAEPHYVELWYGDVLRFEEAAPVAVAEGQVVAGVDFRLPLGGEMSGQVREGASGDPLAGVSVAAHLAPDWSWSRVAESDADGSYTLAGIPAGSFRVSAWTDTMPYAGQYWDHVSCETEATGITIQGQEVVGDVDFDLFREAVIAGTVVRADNGSSIAGAAVEAHELSWRWGGEATSDANGGFRIGHLPPAGYQMSADAEGFGAAMLVDEGGNPVTLVLGEGEQRADVVIRLAEGGAISGRVVRAADGSPVVDGFVWARPLGGGEGGGDNTDSNGSYRVEGLPAGAYAVLAEGAEGDNLVRQLRQQPVAVVVGQEVTGVDFALEEGGMVAGVVVTAATGEPVAGARVEANIIGGDYGRGATTGPDGSFHVVGLPGGAYVVATLHPDFLFQAFDGALFPEEATPVEVNVGQTTGPLRFALQPAARISGTVREGSSGTPLEGILVAAYLNPDRQLLGAWAETDASGHYTLGSALPGQDLFVVAFDWRNRFAWQWYEGVLLPWLATPVVTWIGQPAEGVDFALRPAGAATVSPTALAFAGRTYDEQIPPQQLAVSNPGPGPTAVMLWAEGDFLAVEYDWANAVVEPGATLPVNVMVWTWGLGAGTHNGTVHVVDVLTGRELLVPVTLELEEAPPSLGVATPELWFETEEGGPGADPEPLFLFNLGGGEVSFSASTNVSWASVQPTSGAVRRGEGPVELSVTVDHAGMAIGSHEGVITLASPSGNRQVALHLEVVAAASGDPILQAPRMVEVRAEVGGPPVTTTFRLANVGTGPVLWRARVFEPFLSVEPRFGVIPVGSEPQNVQLTVDPGPLSNGVTSAFFRIATPREDAWVEVRIVVGGGGGATGGIAGTSRGHLMVPVVVHAPGAHGADFVSDVWISHRPTGQDAQARVAFVPYGADGSQQAYVTDLTFTSGQTISLLDIVQDWIGGPKSDKGSLVIISDSIDEFEATSRTYNVVTEKGPKGLNGTFGQEILGISSEQGLGRSEGSLHVTALERSDGFRSNLLLAEVSGQTATAQVDLFDQTGESLGSTQVEVQPFGVTQVNDVLGAVGQTGSVHGARAEVTVVDGAGRVVTLGSVVDNTTNDPTTISGVRKDATGESQLLPVVAHTAGVAGTQWVSDVVVTNVDTAARQVTLTYRDSSGALVGTDTQSLAAGQTAVLDDVVGTTFSETDSRGSLLVEASPVGGVVVVSRTYNVGATGTYGQGTQTVAAGQGVAASGGVLRLIALHNTEQYRTNVGITEMSGQAVTVGITLYDAAGSEALGYVEWEVPAYGQVQKNLFEAVGLADTNVVAATAVIQVVSGSGSVTVYASMVDNTTGDGTTLPPPEQVQQTGVAVPEGGD